jgi:hypothetical protein
MIATLGSATEEGSYSIGFVDLCEEFEALNRRVEMKGMDIQQTKLEDDEGPH